MASKLQGSRARGQHARGPWRPQYRWRRDCPLRSALGGASGEDPPGRSPWQRARATQLLPGVSMLVPERVDAYRALFKLARSLNRSPGEQWAPDFTRVRVRLGTGLADYALPYTLHDDLKRALQSGLLELAFLYLRRHADRLGDDA